MPINSDFKHCDIKMVDKRNPTIFLLHGFMSNREIQFRKLKKEIKYGDLSEYNLISCDANGHGHNREGSFRDWNEAFDEEEKMINDIEGDVILIGHSMGATKAISHGLINPKVTKVIAISGLYDDDELRMIGEKLKLPNYRRLVLINLKKLNKAFPKNNKDKTYSNDHSNIYLIHGRQDTTVSIDEFYKNKENLDIPDDNTLIVNGKHIIDENRKVIKFIKEKLKE